MTRTGPVLLLAALLIGAAALCLDDLSPDAVHINDFETSGDLDGIEWKCRTWFELSDRHVASGAHSLMADLPPGKYPGITFPDLPVRNWNPYDRLSIQVAHDGEEDLMLVVRIDDADSGYDYGQRANLYVRIRPGPNRIEVPIARIRESPSRRPLDTANINRVILFLYNTSQRQVLYLDDFKLEKKQRWPGTRR